MGDFSVNFTQEDYHMIESYKIIVEGLADYMGNGYELVLHSLENLDHSVVKIINGYYTGRREGSPITNLALSMLAKIEETPDTNYISYFNYNKNGEPLKSATIVIRGHKNQAIGLLCINFYMNTSVFDFLHNYTQPQAQDMKVAENFVENVHDLISETVNEIRELVQNDSSVSSVNKNKEIITLLYHRGIFNLKDGVVKVAKLLGISKNTVYMHIRNLK